MLKAHRAALKSLLREFQRAANKYSPIFWEWFVLDDEFIAAKGEATEVMWKDGLLEVTNGRPCFSRDRTGELVQLPWSMQRQVRIAPEDVPTIWRAFIDVNRAQQKTDWEEWELHVDGTECHRFYGGRDGFDDFRRLAESLCYVFNELDLKGDSRAGYTTCLFTFYFMSEESPTPLLRNGERNWGRPIGTPLDLELLHEWAIEDNRTPLYPIHTTCCYLANNVFTSAIAAIEQILAPDQVMLLPGTTDRLRMGFIERMAAATLEDSQATSSESASEAFTDSSTNGQDAPFVFQLKKNVWEVRYTCGAEVETTHFPHSTDFERIARLLRNPGMEITAVDLARTSEDAMHASEALERHKKHAVDFSESNAMQTWRSEQAVMDAPGQRKIANAIALLDERISEAKAKGGPDGLEKAEEYAKQRDELAHHLAITRGLKGKARTFPIGSPSGKSKNCVRTSYSRFLRKVKPEMPRFFKHLKASIQQDDKGFIWCYDPAVPITWIT